MENHERPKEPSLSDWVEDRMAVLRPDADWRPDKLRAAAMLRQARSTMSRRRRRWAWALPAAITACLPLMAIPSAREFAQQCVSVCVSESSWAARFLGVGPHASTVYVKLQDRRMAPDFSLNDPSGNPVKLSDFKGKVVLLNLWATWCGPCKVEIPWFEEFQRSYQSRGFAVLGVSLDEDGWTAVKPYVDEHALNYTVVVGNDNLAQLLGAGDAIPTTLIIDRSGRIAAKHLGLCKRSEYESDIQAALNESN